jgi:hypothetical protein
VILPTWETKWYAKHAVHTFLENIVIKSKQGVVKIVKKYRNILVTKPMSSPLLFDFR